MTQVRTHPPRRGAGRAGAAARAFSLLELVVVVVIIGIIAAVAIPRMSRAGQTSRESSTKANLAVFEKALAFYAAEHQERPATLNPDGSQADGDTVLKRLRALSAIDGDFSGSTGRFGPYLRSAPVNPMNGLATLRVDTGAPGKGTDGWHLNPSTGVLTPDDAAMAAAVAAERAGAAAPSLSAGANTGTDGDLSATP